MTVNLVNSFLPLAGESFDILDWSSLSNNAFPVILPTLGGRIVWDKSQLFTTGTISVTATYFTGDVNRDGIVTVADVQALMTALTNLPTYQTSNSLTDPVLFRDVADVNGDGVINNADVQALINLVANKASGGSRISSVPEPPRHLSLRYSGFHLWVDISSTRLELIPGSCQCSRQSRFFTDSNKDG